MFLLVLTACGPLDFEEYPDGTPEKTAGQWIAVDENALPVETQLILGTLLLEETDLAVDPQQAAELLPLWEKWHDLERGNTAADGDREALLEQIQAAMTEEQIQAIADMNLTRADITKLMEEAGVGFPGTQSGTPEVENPGEDGSPGAVEGTPSGEPSPPDDDDLPFPSADETLSPDQIATFEALRSVYSVYGGSRGPSWMLLHALIELLESKQAS